jgi:hypothetical protein
MLSPESQHLSKQITPVVGAVFPLSDARRVHELSQTGHGRGRIVMQMAL